MTSKAQTKDSTEDSGSTIPQSTPQARPLVQGSDLGITVPLSPNGASVEIVSVTPDQAQEWLHSNRNNRTVRKVVVERYAASMRAGAWTLSPDAIAIRADGNLDNGQHRLAAIVETGIPVRLVVLHGLHLEDKINIDRGVKRSLADYLQMERSETSAILLASVINVVWKWDALGAKLAASAQSARGSAEVYELLKCFDGDAEAFRETVSRHTTYSQIPLRPSLMLGAFHVFKRLDYEMAEHFFSSFSNGAGLNEGDPLLVLRAQLFAERSKAEQVSAPIQLAWLIKAWNAYRRAEKVQVFRLQAKDKYPEPI